MNPDTQLPKDKAIKIYTALLNQSGTNAPIPTILQNDIGNIIWTYTAPGIYVATLSQAFTTDKTTLILGLGGGDPEMSYNSFFVSQNVIQLEILLAASPEDDCLNNATIEIKVYS